MHFTAKNVEIDNDSEYSTNTGAFRNTEPNSFDHIINVDGQQCAFLGSEAGNAFVQDLNSVYKSGYNYRFTVAIGVSSQFPPSQINSIDTLELALFYRGLVHIQFTISLFPQSTCPSCCLGGIGFV